MLVQQIQPTRCHRCACIPDVKYRRGVHSVDREDSALQVRYTASKASTGDVACREVLTEQQKKICSLNLIKYRGSRTSRASVVALSNWPLLVSVKDAPACQAAGNVNVRRCMLHCILFNGNPGVLMHRIRAGARGSICPPWPGVRVPPSLSQCVASARTPARCWGPVLCAGAGARRGGAERRGGSVPWR